MHEAATITIAKIWDPFKPGDKRTNLEDTEGAKWRVEVETARPFRAGQTVDIDWTPGSFQGNHFKLIENIRDANGGVSTPAGGKAVTAAPGGVPNGAEKGMIMRENVGLIISDRWTDDEIVEIWERAERIYNKFKGRALNIGDAF